MGSTISTIEKQRKKFSRSDYRSMAALVEGNPSPILPVTEPP